MKNIISIDVEDWFHILELDSTPRLDAWDRMESRVEKNFMNMLAILDEKNVKATCFFLGWIAEKFPRLVKEAAKQNHEIASHGYSHQLIYSQTKSQFFNDILRTRQQLEDLCGAKVVGYRAPGFSITPETAWAFSQLVVAGYQYDSSLFPAKRGHGFFLDAKLHPFKLTGLDFYEFPITVSHFLSKKICFFGGGYLRLFPYFLIRIHSKKVAKENRPVIYYIHPREIDVSQPRLEMNWKRKFKSYINLKTTETKVKKIIASGNFTTFQGFLNEFQEYFNEPAMNMLINE